MGERYIVIHQGSGLDGERGALTIEKEWPGRRQAEEYATTCVKRQTGYRYIIARVVTEVFPEASVRRFDAQPDEPTRSPRTNEEG
jgi:hypothetical protein